MNLPDAGRSGSLPDVDERAAAFVLRRQLGPWSGQDENESSALLADPQFAEACARAERAWHAVGSHATAPELMVLREQALGAARRTAVRRWLKPRGLAHWGAAVAAAVVLAVSGTLALDALLDPTIESDYVTGIGEQRVVELEDRSRVALDAGTVLHVRLTRDSRIIELEQGQAQFIVAPDRRRPFSVHAGEHTITAIGTSFNVEYLDERMQVAMVEGKVAVSLGPTGNESGAGSRRTVTDLVAGEELRVEPDGRARLVRHADIDAVMAWRQGKVILKNTPLHDAVRRLNRYSRTQVRIDDPTLGEIKVSGVFETGDTHAFVDALQSYLPVNMREQAPDLLILSPRR